MPSPLAKLRHTRGKLPLPAFSPIPIVSILEAFSAFVIKLWLHLSGTIFDRVQL